MDFIAIQQNDFSVDGLYQSLLDKKGSQGAIVTFVGLVRSHDLNSSSNIDSLQLEHYPGMTEKSLQKIITHAREQWALGKISIVHRIGKLLVGEQIVFVGVTSSHRKSAFEACEFIIDFLKTQAPFWKKESSAEGEKWVEAKQSDRLATTKWQ